MTKTLTYIALLSLLLASNTINASNVANTSKESFAQYGKEDAYWVVTVTCNDNSEHIVQRKTDQEAWCPKGNDSTCNEDKTAAFNTVCSEAYAIKSKEIEAAEELKRQEIAAQQQQEQAQQAQAQQAQNRQTEEEKAAALQAIRDAEQKIQQQIFIEESIQIVQRQLATLSNREREIQRRIAEIDALIESDDEEEDI